MKHNSIAILAICFATGSVKAANFSFTGNFSNDDEVQPFNFSVVGSAADVSLRTWSYAGETNAGGTEIARGNLHLEEINSTMLQNCDAEHQTRSSLALTLDSLNEKKLSLEEAVISCITKCSFNEMASWSPASPSALSRNDPLTLS